MPIGKWKSCRTQTWLAMKCFLFVTGSIRKATETTVDRLYRPRRTTRGGCNTLRRARFRCSPNGDENGLRVRDLGGWLGLPKHHHRQTEQSCAEQKQAARLRRRSNPNERLRGPVQAGPAGGRNIKLIPGIEG